jgi:pilus assembly protein Flp/PilA
MWPSKIGSILTSQAGLGRTNNHGENKMNNLLLKLYVEFQDLASREEGQDLVEYALVVALIAFGATAGMKQLSGAINTAFSNISSTLATSIT